MDVAQVLSERLPFSLLTGLIKIAPRFDQARAISDHCSILLRIVAERDDDSCRNGINFRGERYRLTVVAACRGDYPVVCARGGEMMEEIQTAANLEGACRQVVFMFEENA